MISKRKRSLYKDLKHKKKSKIRRNMKNATFNFKALFNRSKATYLIFKRLKEDSLKNKQMQIFY